jgi:hypothetical protein
MLVVVVWAALVSCQSLMYGCLHASLYSCVLRIVTCLPPPLC